MAGLSGQKEAEFRFYEELNDFLPEVRKKKTFTYSFRGKPAIKDAIEALGVPHTEVDLILVNGKSVRFNYHLQPADHVSVYPLFESFDITPLAKLHPVPLRRRQRQHLKFVLDVHLGKLAHLLRMLGFDSLYQKDYNDDEIREIALKEKRIILTRDQDLLKAKIVTHGYWLRSTTPLQQAIEIIRRFDLKSCIKPFVRCLACNGMIKKINKTRIVPRLPAGVLSYYQEFFQCSNCRKIYWQGSHFRKMQEKISLLIRD